MSDGQILRLAELIRSRFAAQLVGAMPDPAVIVGPEGRVAAANRPALDLLPALKIDDPFVLALRAPDIVDAHRRVMANGETETVQWSERVPVERLFDVCVAPLAATEGEVVATLLTLRDLTESRQVERMRVDFIANASHELRTPLASLLGFIETLQGSARQDPKARDRFLSIMQEQGRRMARLIDDLLSLSRIELNAHRRPDTPVDLVPIIRQVSDGLETLARDRGVSVNITGAGALSVLGDHDELLRVFENLIENALKYGAAGRRVDIKIAMGSSAEGDQEAQVSVRDYGPGIAPEHLPRLTERFYRVDVAESRAQGGTGLGLALVKHILNRHRGRLTIDSTPGVGATFTVHLPTVVTAVAR